MGVFRKSLWFLFSTLAIASVAEDTPDPKEVYVESIKHNGQGCRPGSVSHLMSPDAKAFTLLFDDFVVEGDKDEDKEEDEDEEKTRKACQIDLDLHVPAGWSYTLFSMDYRGFADLKRGSVGIQRTAFFFHGTPDKERDISNFRLKGPIAQDYFNRAITQLDAKDFSSCSGKDKKFRINTSIAVKGEGMMTVDSADGELKQQYGIAWRRCTPPPPPPPPPRPLRGDVVALRMPGNGFDGDLDLCLDFKTGRISTRQVGDDWRGIVNLIFEVDTTLGRQPLTTHVAQTPSSVQLPGDWSGVRNVIPVVTSWSRLAGKGKPPLIVPHNVGHNRCLRLIDGPDGRPGAVKLAIDWRIQR